MLSAYSHMMGMYPLGTGLNVTNDVPETKLPPFANPAPQISGSYALEEGYRAIPVNVLDPTTDYLFMRAFDDNCKGAVNYCKTEENKRINSQERIDLVAPIGQAITAAGFDSMTYFNQSNYTSKTAGIFADVDKCYYYYNGIHMGNATTGQSVSGIAD
jgi:hypothetical protein